MYVAYVHALMWMCVNVNDRERQKERERYLRALHKTCWNKDVNWINLSCVMVSSIFFFIMLTCLLAVGLFGKIYKTCKCKLRSFSYIQTFFHEERCRAGCRVFNRWPMQRVQYYFYRTTSWKFGVIISVAFYKSIVTTVNYIHWRATGANKMRMGKFPNNYMVQSTTPHLIPLCLCDSCYTPL